MDRRAFIGTLAGGLLSAPLGAQAQPAGKVPRIGWLVFGAPFTDASPDLEAVVLRGLRDLGYLEGSNIVIEYRHAGGRSQKLPELASELVRLKVDVLLGIGGDIGEAFKNATGTIPIVVASSADPVRAHLVVSLARPGGNLTGMSFISDEMAAKRVELLREAMPRVSRLGILWDPGHVDSDFLEVQRATRRLGIHLESLEIRSQDELEAAIQKAIRARVEALIVVTGRLTAFLGKQIAELAAQRHIPVVSGWREFAEDGAVLTYGPDRVYSAKRLALYVDKILKGAKPADLPVEQPIKFDLVINLKTAKALGLTIPPSLLQRADQVIE